MRGNTSAETHFQFVPRFDCVGIVLMARQCDDNIPRVRIENASRSTPDDILSVKRGDESRWWDSRTTVENKNPAGGRQRYPEKWTVNKEDYYI